MLHKPTKLDVGHIVFCVVLVFTFYIKLKIFNLKVKRKTTEGENNCLAWLVWSKAYTMHMAWLAWNKAYPDIYILVDMEQGLPNTHGLVGWHGTRPI